MAEFLDRWHDEDGNGVKLNHLAVVLWKKDVATFESNVALYMG